MTKNPNKPKEHKKKEIEQKKKKGKKWENLKKKKEEKREKQQEKLGSKKIQRIMGNQDLEREYSAKELSNYSLISRLPSSNIHI